MTFLPRSSARLVLPEGAVLGSEKSGAGDPICGRDTSTSVATRKRAENGLPRYCTQPRDVCRGLTSSLGRGGPYSTRDPGAVEQLQSPNAMALAKIQRLIAGRAPIQMRYLVEVFHDGLNDLSVTPRKGRN